MLLHLYLALSASIFAGFRSCVCWIVCLSSLFFRKRINEGVLYKVKVTFLQTLRGLNFFFLNVTHQGRFSFTANLNSLGESISEKKNLT